MFAGRKVHRYEIEDFLEQDLLERSEKVEADFRGSDCRISSGEST